VTTSTTFRQPLSAASVSSAGQPLRKAQIVVRELTSGRGAPGNGRGCCSPPSAVPPPSPWARVNPDIVDKLWTPVERDLPAMVARLEAAVLGERMTASLATSALRSAIARRQAVGTVVVHSNRGGQFCSRAFQALLKRPSGSAVR
jgi:hypothetical protein